MKEKSERRVLLGKVGVDSGQLMIIDPCYVEGEWRAASAAEPVALMFWGRDQAAFAEKMASSPVVGELKEAGAGAYLAYPAEGHTLGAVSDEFVRIKRETDLLVVRRMQTTSSYDEVCNLTQGPDRGGALPFARGHEGLGVAFRSGFGDGTYEVWATIRDCGPGPLGGERVAKVEVILISDDEE